MKRFLEAGDISLIILAFDILGRCVCYDWSLTGLSLAFYRFY